MIKFHELRLLGTLKLEKLDEGQDIEAAMVANNAQHHHTCRLKYNYTELQREKKEILKTERERQDIAAAKKCTRSPSSLSRREPNASEVCLFRGQCVGTEGLQEAAIFQIDSHIRACAILLEDTELLGQLSVGDMVAMEAKCHTNCLVGLYNHARKTKYEGPKDSEQEQRVSAIVFKKD